MPLGASNNRKVNNDSVFTLHVFYISNVRASLKMFPAKDDARA